MVNFLDTQKLLKILERLWNDAFRDVLERSHRSMVNELLMFATS